MAHCDACKASGRWCGRCDVLSALRNQMETSAQREAVEWHRLRMAQVGRKVGE